MAGFEPARNSLPDCMFTNYITSARPYYDLRDCESRGSFPYCTEADILKSRPIETARTTMENTMNKRRTLKEQKPIKIPEGARLPDSPEELARAIFRSGAKRAKAEGEDEEQ